MDIQLGIDIATSVSVIAAAISFGFAQLKARNQQAAQFAVENLKGFLGFIKDTSIKYDSVGNDFRAKVTKMGDKALESRNELLNQHFLEIIFLAESLSKELDDQIRIYFPLFSPKGSATDLLLGQKNKLEGILGKLKSDNMKTRYEGLEIFESSAVLRELEKNVANELKLILKMS